MLVDMNMDDILCVYVLQEQSLLCKSAPPVLVNMNMDDILCVYVLQEQSLLCNSAPCAGRYEHG